MPSAAAQDVLQAILERRAAQKRREMAAVQGAPLSLPFSNRIAGAFEAAQPVRQVDELSAPITLPFAARNQLGDWHGRMPNVVKVMADPRTSPFSPAAVARLFMDPAGEVGRQVETGRQLAEPFTQFNDPQVDPVKQGADLALTVGAGGLATAAEREGLGVFGGSLARTADLDALSLAKKMAAEGVPRERIWQETGWFKAPDKEWKFEISDEASRIGGPAMADLAARGETKRPTAGVLHHKDLYAAYPELREIDVNARHAADYPGSSGYYDAVASMKGPEIGIAVKELAGSEGPRSVMLHELQHPVQRIEGFGQGGSPAAYAHGPMFDEKARSLQGALSQELTGGLSHSPKDIIQDISLADPVRTEEIAREHGFTSIWDALKFLKQQDEMRTPMGQYRRLAGEVEARNVQDRRNMTAEERRATPPWTTQDVPDEQQIVRFRTPEGSAQESRAKVPAAGRNVSSRDNGGPPLNSPAIVRKKKFETPFSDIKRDNPIEDVTATYTKGQKLLPEKQFDISQVPEGSHFVSTFGDRSGAGRRLTGIGGEKFDQPVDLWGGSGYAQRAHNPDEAGWASGKGVITKLQNKIRPLQETGKPVFLIHTGMAPVAVDFSSMTSNTLLQQMKNRPLSEAARKVFDARMEAQWGKDHPARPDWPGLEAVEKGDYTMSGPERLKFVKLMDTDAMRKLGAPDVGAARWAITDPRQRNSPFLGTGSSIFRLGEGVGHNPSPLVGHPDYPSALTSKGGQYVGTLPEIIHGLEFFQDVKRGLKPGVTNESHIGRKFLMSPAIQRVSPEWMQHILNYLKSSSGQKLGIAGAVGAGLLTAEQAQEMFGSEPGQEKT